MQVEKDEQSTVKGEGYKICTRESGVEEGQPAAGGNHILYGVL